MFMSHRFFTQVNAMPSGSTVADQLARSAGAHGALRNLAHGDSLTKNLGRA